MNCPNCHHEAHSTDTCNQCGSTFCPSCQPYFDYTSHVCQGCQEINSVEAIREHGLSERMRRWFSKAAPLPEELSLVSPPPWGIDRAEETWCVYEIKTDIIVAVFFDLATAEYVCHAVNAHHDLATVAAITYNRIREGVPFWTGTRRDCELWGKVRKLMK